MERPFEAYDGDEPYVFVCYSHADKGVVYPELIRLKDAGFHIWYDEGIGAGSEWSESIARHIEGCTAFVYFVTPRSVEREHCRRELNFAIDQSRRVLAVHLVPTELPSGLKLTLSNRQAILKHDETPSAYEAKLARAIGDARSHDSAVPSTHVRPGAKRRRAVRWLGAAVIAMAIAAVLSVWYANRSMQHASLPDRSLAVLPFSVVGSDAETASYADAVTQELRTDVAGYQEIRSIAVADVTSIRDVSDASYAAGGNVERRGDAVRIRASLTRTDDRQTVWAETFERKLADENADPTTTASTIARFIRQQLAIDQRCESVRRTARSAEAATAYCAALAEQFRYGQIGDMDAQLMFSEAQHAVALDPDIPGAYGLMAQAYLEFARTGAMDWRDAARNADDALARGLALAPNDGSLLSIRGYVQGELEFDFPAAESSLRASLSREPANPGSYLMLARLALARGDVNAALEDARRAWRIDDSGAPANVYYSGMLSLAGQNHEAVKVADAGLALVQTGPPRFGLLQIKAIAYHSLGETAAANAAIDDLLSSLRPAWRPAFTGTVAYIGRVEEARRLLAELEAIKDPPIEPMVNAYAQLDHDRAFEWIHKAIDHHIWGTIEVLRVGPTFSELRKDPRWAQVMAHLESEEAEGRALDQSSE